MRSKTLWSAVLAILAVAMILAMIISAAALHSRPKDTMPGQHYKIGVLLKAMDSEHWLAVRAGMQAEARDQHIGLVVLSPDSESDFDSQDRIIHELMDGGFDALIVAPVDWQKSASYAAEAAKRGIMFLTIDEQVPGVPYVGSDNYEIGRKAAKALAERLPAGSSVGVLAGSQRSHAHRERLRGFTEVIQGETGLTLAAAISDEANFKRSASQAEAMMKQHPELKGLFLTSTPISLGAADAMANSGHNLCLIGVDAQADTLLAVKNGQIATMVSQDAEAEGRLAVQSIITALENGTSPDDVIIENDLITKDNVSDFLENMEGAVN